MHASVIRKIREREREREVEGESACVIVNGTSKEIAAFF